MGEFRRDASPAPNGTAWWTPSLSAPSAMGALSVLARKPSNSATTVPSALAAGLGSSMAERATAGGSLSSVSRPGGNGAVKRRRREPSSRPVMLPADGGVLMAEVTIEATPNGPYLVTGPIELRDTDGKVLATKSKVWLCRCGASTKKPFCDGTHSKIGFQAAAQAVPGSAEAG